MKIAKNQETGKSVCHLRIDFGYYPDFPFSFQCTYFGTRNTTDIEH